MRQLIYRKDGLLAGWYDTDKVASVIHGPRHQEHHYYELRVTHKGNVVSYGLIGQNNDFHRPLDDHEIMTWMIEYDISPSEIEKLPEAVQNMIRTAMDKAEV